MGPATDDVFIYNRELIDNDLQSLPHYIAIIKEIKVYDINTYNREVKYEIKVKLPDVTPFNEWGAMQHEGLEQFLHALTSESFE